MARARELAEEIAADNGAMLYDDEYMTCRGCGAEALGPREVSHARDCPVMVAQWLLEGP